MAKETKNEETTTSKKTTTSKGTKTSKKDLTSTKKKEEKTPASNTKASEKSTVKKTEAPKVGKRALPEDTPKEEIKSPSKLTKRSLPEETKEEKPKEKKIDIFQKKTSESTEKPREKSNSEKMRDVIQARKKLNDLTTDQAVQTQQRDLALGKAQRLREDEEDEALIEAELDHKALETENNKLKQDLEKANQKLQSLLALEYDHLKVLDEHQMSLSTEFVKSIHQAQEAALQNAIQKEEEKEQSLIDELNSLQKEISSLKAKNKEAIKASEKAQEVAAKAQKAVNEAKKAIEEQESNEIRNFKGEIETLEQKLKSKEKELEKVKAEHEKELVKKEKALQDAKNNFEKQRQEEIEKTKKQIQDLEVALKKSDAQIEELNEQNKTLKSYEEKYNEEHLKLQELKDNSEKDIANYQKQLESNSKKFKDYEAQFLTYTTLFEQFQKTIDELSSNASSEDVKALQEKYQKVLTSLEVKEKEVEELSEKIKNLESISKEQPALEDAKKYQDLLASERESHLQVEQKLCSDLNGYKSKIEELQAELLTMGKDYQLNQLHQQVESLQKFIEEVKKNPGEALSHSIYNECYEQIREVYKIEAELFEESRTLIQNLYEEKKKILEEQKQEMKDTTLLEKQIQEIENLLAFIKNHQIQDKVLEIEKMEEKILTSFQDQFKEYAEKLESQKNEKEKEMDLQYHQETSVNRLIAQYKKDYDGIQTNYSNEVAKLNLEISLDLDMESKEKKIQKILLLQQEVKKLIQTLNHKFHSSLDIIRQEDELSSLEFTEPEAYLRILGEQYQKNMEMFAQEKQATSDEINQKNESYQFEIRKQKQAYEQLSTKLSDLKKASSTSQQSKEEYTEQFTKIEEQLTRIKNVTLPNLEEELNEKMKELRLKYDGLVKEELETKKLFKFREQKIRENLKREKERKQNDETFVSQQEAAQQEYHLEESRRIIEEIQEKRTTEKAKETTLLQKENSEERRALQSSFNERSKRAVHLMQKYNELQKVRANYEKAEKRLSSTVRVIKQYKEYVFGVQEGNRKREEMEQKMVELTKKNQLDEAKSIQVLQTSLIHQIEGMQEKITRLEELNEVKEYLRILDTLEQLNVFSHKYQENMTKLQVEISRMQEEMKKFGIA